MPALVSVTYRPIESPSVGNIRAPVIEPTQVASPSRCDRSPTKIVWASPSVTSRNATALLRKKTPSPSGPGSPVPYIPTWFDGATWQTYVTGAPVAASRFTAQYDDAAVSDGQRNPPTTASRPVALAGTSMARLKLQDWNSGPCSRCGRSIAPHPHPGPVSSPAALKTET